MKRYLSSISCLLIAVYGFALIGCGPSQAQITAEQSFYASKVMMAKQASSQPIFEMTASDSKQPIVLQNVSALRVFQASSSSGNDGLTQYVHRDYAAPWVQLLGTTMSVALPWFGAYKMVEAISTVIPKTGNSTNINTNGDGNKTQISGDLGITANANAGNVTMPTTMAGVLDQTSTPTVVNQPAPLVVTQPDPVIVTQPAPVIVEPKVVTVEPTVVQIQPSYPPTTIPTAPAPTL